MEESHTLSRASLWLQSLTSYPLPVAIPISTFTAGLHVLYSYQLGSDVGPSRRMHLQPGPVLDLFLIFDLLRHYLALDHER